MVLESYYGSGVAVARRFRNIHPSLPSIVRMRIQVILFLTTISGSNFTSVPSNKGVIAEGEFRSGSRRTIAPLPDALITASMGVGCGVIVLVGVQLGRGVFVRVGVAVFGRCVGEGRNVSVANWEGVLVIMASARFPSKTGKDLL